MIGKYFIFLGVLLSVFTFSDQRLILAINAYNEGFYELSLRHAKDYVDRGGDSANGKYIIGLSYYNLKRYDEALFTLNEILIDFPEFQYRNRVNLYIALIHKQKGDLKRSFSILNNLKKTPLADLAYYYEGIFHKEQRDAQKAEASLKYIAENYIESEKWEDSLRELAYLYRDMGRFDQEKIIIETYLEKNPRGKYRNEMSLLNSLLLYRVGSYNEAIEVLQKLYNQNYRISEVSFYIAECFYYLEKYTESARFYNISIDNKTPHLTQAYNYLFLSYYNIPNIDNALLTLKKIQNLKLGISPNEISYYYAMSYNKQGKNNEAAKYLEEIIEKCNTTERMERAVTLYAVVMSTLNRMQRAVEYAKKALSRQPGSFRIAEICGDLNFNMNDFKAASESYEGVLQNKKLTRDDISLVIKLVRSLYFNNEFEKALKTLKIYNFNETNEYKLWLGKTYYKLKDLDNANKMLSSIPKGQDSYYESMRFLGWTNFESRNIYQAIEIWGRTIDEYPDRDDLYWELKFDIGKAYYTLKNYKMALPIFIEISSKELRADLLKEINFYLSKIYYRLENYNQAIVYFSKIIGDVAYRHEAEFYIAWCHLSLGDHKTAIERFKRIYQDSSNPFRYDSILKVGDIHYNKGEFTQASEIFQSILDGDAPSEYKGWAAYNYEWTLLKMGKYDKTTDISEKFLEKYPTSPIAPQIQMNKGKLYFSKDEFQKALGEFQKLLMRYPDSSEVYEAKYLIGLCFLKVNNRDRAYLYFEELIKDTNSGKWGDLALFKITSILVDEEKYKQAVSNYIKLLDSNPTEELMENVLFNLATVHKKTRNYLQSIQYYERLLNVSKSNEMKSEVHIKLGELYEITGDHKKAEESYTKAISIGTKIQQVEAEYWLGELYFNREMYQQAIEEFMKIIYLYKEFPNWENSARFRIVDAYVNMGDKENAQKMLQLIRDNSKDRESVQKAVDMLKKMN